MQFSVWNVRSLYSAGLPMTVEKEISKYELDLMGVQEVSWDRGSMEPAGKYTFLHIKVNKNHELVKSFSYIRESY
jgi:hypothetical protein